MIESVRVTPTPRVVRPAARIRSLVLRGGSLTVLWVWTAVILGPLVFALQTSLRPNEKVFTSPFEWAGTLRFDNFARAWTDASIGTYLINTVAVVLPTVALTLVLSSMAAYVIARYPFTASRAVYSSFIVGLAFPLFLAIVPLFFVAKSFSLTNSLLGLVVVYTAYNLPFSVFFLTAFFRSLPGDLVDAAFVDGLGHWRAFAQIMLPVARPGLVTVGIFNALGSWNQYLLPIVLVNDSSKFVLTQGLANLAVQERSSSDYSALFAALLISIVPILIVYVLFRRQVQAGFTSGSFR